MHSIFNYGQHIGMERWQNKVAVVTGASVGIGAAIVKDLLRSGLQVVGLSRRLEVLQDSKHKLPQELQRKYTVFKCDVGDVNSVDEAFDKIIDQFGGVDILVNSAAVMNCGSLVTNDVCNVQEIIQTNVMGVVHCTKRAFQSMKERNFDGHIILLNSIVGHSIPCLPAAAPPMLGMYVASKYALTAITEMYRQEFMHYKTKIKMTVSLKEK